MCCVFTFSLSPQCGENARNLRYICKNGSAMTSRQELPSRGKFNTIVYINTCKILIYWRICLKFQQGVRFQMRNSIRTQFYFSEFHFKSYINISIYAAIFSKNAV